MCKILGVSVSGYYEWRCRGQTKQSVENMKLLGAIESIWEENRRVYGSPRIFDELRERGHRCGVNRVARLMRQHGVRSIATRKFVATTNSAHHYPVVRNLLERNFSCTTPDTVWVSDAAFVHTAAGWCYLVVIVDLYSRKVVGWSLGRRNDAMLVQEAIKTALEVREPPEIFHSDRGSPYASEDTQALLRQHGIFTSMSRSGDCWDNAVAESFFATLRKELLFHRRLKNYEHARAEIFGYIEGFYNTKRRHSAAGRRSPVDFEQQNTLP